MNNFGNHDDHKKVTPQLFGQCSHHSHRNYNHHHPHINHPTVPSCCVPQQSCCVPQQSCCKPNPPECRSSRCYNTPCRKCTPTTCSCHESTQDSTAGQGYYWRDYFPGEIPYDAVGGIDGKYVGQVNFNGNVLPATIYTDTGVAVAERYGRRTFTKNFKILCSVDSTNIHWEHVNFYQVTDEQMKYAIKGGYENGYDLYIGVAYHDGEWRIGKVIPKEICLGNGLQICNNFGNRININEFHILKYRSPNLRRAAVVRQDFYWRDYIPDEIPHDAVVGANDLYIGQVYYDSCLLPATIYPYYNVAITERNGKQIIKDKIKILCSPDPSKFYWEKNVAPFGYSFGMGTNTFPQNRGGTVFGAQANQPCSIFGTQSNKIPGTGLFGAQQSQTFGSSQNQTKPAGVFGSPQQNLVEGCNGTPQGTTKTSVSNTFSPNGGGVLFGAQANQTSSCFGTQSNKNSGAQSSQILNSSGTPSKLAGGFGSPQQNLIEGCNGTQPSFSFGIPQDMTKDNLENLQKNDKQQIQGGTVFGNGSPISISSQNIATAFGSSQTQGDLQGDISCNQTQTQLKNHIGTTFGSPQGQNPCSLNSSLTFGGQNISTGFGNSQAPKGGGIFGCSQNQSGSIQPQGTTSLFGLGQNQGFGGRSGFVNNQGNNFMYNPWKNNTERELLKDMVKGGYQEYLDLYIGKAFHAGEWKIGKVISVNGMNKVLHVWGRFNECIVLYDFEILKYRAR